MASFTKKAILASFMKLCAKKSPEKITVRDIVDDCEINRNTFYYYYQDIYALVEEVFGLWAEDFVRVLGDRGDPEAGLCALAQWALEHKRAVVNLMETFDGRVMEEYFLGATAEAWIDWTRGQAEGDPISDEAIRYVAMTYAYGFYSILARWIRGSMREEPQRIARHYCTIWVSHASEAMECYEREFGKGRGIRSYTTGKEG